MWARTQLKISWRDLLTGGLACILPTDRTRLVEQVEGYFAGDFSVLAAYSVRSGFDLLLQALDLNEGDEVLFSALNIRGMVTIARRAGLMPVPVDLDIAHMAPSIENLRAAITPKSKVLVVAHLFGTRLDMQPLVDFAHQHDLLLVEDCAQAFNGRAYSGH
ncbi:MAG: aminotransferase class V-fold PLP-dependent enzyme, partial [Proteobacteria bacterium]|nr:aminotransferase class V-fold PLP-dependent enzyme [Pseudomonadota bacterium]